MAEAEQLSDQTPDWHGEVPRSRSRHVQIGLGKAHVCIPGELFLQPTETMTQQLSLVQTFPRIYKPNMDKVTSQS